MGARHLAALALAILASLAAATTAWAAPPPVLPLSEVRAGQRCQGLTVVRGTAIERFDLEVVDVVAGDNANAQPFVMVRASGPLIDAAEGIAQGFSGSPVLCPAADGSGERVLGAVGYGQGDYGSRLGLVTPIDRVLGERPERGTAAGTSRVRPRRVPGLERRMRSLSVRSIGGLDPLLAEPLRRAAAARGRALSVTGGTPPLLGFGVQPLVPGASVAAGYADGDLVLGATGTVTWNDDGRVFAFGHPLEAAGARRLLLQDAYVYAVAPQPINTADVTSFKIAAPGHAVGTLLWDGRDAVSGRVGALPRTFPVRVRARNTATGEQADVAVRVADETALAAPPGSSALDTVVPVATLQALVRVLDGAPSTGTGDLCATVRLVGRAKAIRMCNRYVGPLTATEEGQAALPGAALAGDLLSFTLPLSTYAFGAPRIRDVSIGLRMRPGTAQAYLESVTAPRRVRRGRAVSVSVRAREVGTGRLLRRTGRLLVPATARPGRRVLRLDGTPADDPTGGGTVIEVVVGDETQEPTDDPGPRTLDGVAAQMERVTRFDGVRARVGAGRAVRVLRDPALRLSGTVKRTITVVR